MELSREFKVGDVVVVTCSELDWSSESKQEESFASLGIILGDDGFGLKVEHLMESFGVGTWYYEGSCVTKIGVL